MRLCLFQPEIPQNAGTLLRMAACLGLGVDIIEPCGFIISDRRLKRAGMDYMEHVDFKIHESYETYKHLPRKGRIVLLSTKSHTPYISFSFQTNDTLMVGRESDGVPLDIEHSVDASVLIPMKPGLRSLNVAVAASMVIGEALRQTQGFYLDEEE
jgi:tRNA (cytidine/uridine-2'-O-)-methyltransferase